MQTPREIVRRTLEFDSPERAPREMWILPWARLNHNDWVERILTDFPMDISRCPNVTLEKPVFIGDKHAIGEYTDEWGCVFRNIREGMMGEVKEPLIARDDAGWEDTSRVHIPREYLTLDVDSVNRYCAETEQFVIGALDLHPFERLQFIRGTTELLMDLMLRPAGMFSFMEELHAFNRSLLEAWCSTDIDGVYISDDWGSQRGLLVRPSLWEELFKPLYREYVSIAHSHGKKVFMHSDGHITAIIPHLIDIGVDALNSQLFCMGLSGLEPYRGQITFWGELDRQWILPHGSLDDIDSAVLEMKERLWDGGGCVAQLEFGLGARPENVYRFYEKWDGAV